MGGPNVDFTGKKGQGFLDNVLVMADSETVTGEGLPNPASKGGSNAEFSAKRKGRASRTTCWWMGAAETYIQNTSPGVIIPQG